MTTLYHTPDRKRWFLVPEETTLQSGALRVRRFAGSEQSTDDGISTYEVAEAEAKAWLDARFNAGFTRAGEALGKLVNVLRTRGGSDLPHNLTSTRPTAREVLGTSPGELYAEPTRAGEAASRLLQWASQRLRPAGSEQAKHSDPAAAFAALGAALKTAAAKVESRRQEAAATPGQRKLLRVGFFAELRHGEKQGVKLADVQRSAPRPDEEIIVNYLQQAPVLIASPGMVRDVLAPEIGYIGSLSFHSDGVWCWPSDLAHYVARYHIELPAAFLAHGAARQWRHVLFDASAVRL